MIWKGENMKFGKLNFVGVIVIFIGAVATYFSNKKKARQNRD